MQLSGTKHFVLTILLLASISLSAQTVVFQFHDGATTNGIDAGTAFDNVSGSASYTKSGVTLTMEAFIDTDVSAAITYTSSNADLIAGGTAFGVDGDPNPPTVTDAQSQQIDNVGGYEESIQFSFDFDGTFDSITLGNIGSLNEAQLVFDGGSTFDLATGTSGAIDLGSDVYQFDFSGLSFTADQMITLQTNSAGSASFNLRSFTITAVPEPSSFAAIFGTVSLALVALRRRRLA